MRNYSFAQKCIQMKGNKLMVADPEGNLVECEVISSHTKESIFQKSIPVLHPVLASFFGFLNLVPGRNKLMPSV